MVDMMLEMSKNNLSTLELTEEEYAVILRRLEQDKPFKALLTLLYFQIGDNKHTRVCYAGAGEKGEYIRDEEDGDKLMLEILYNNLEAMGYRMSDDECALMDGTSPLYYHEGWTPPDDETEPDEAEKETAKTRWEVFREMSDEELDEEISEIDNYSGDFRRAIRECKTADDVANRVNNWLCHLPGACDDPSRYCEECIAAWLEEPYHV
jgi:hypothetical protein